jgi:hypothetical protein
MELFEITKAMFGDTNNYGDATKGDKRKNFFMVQRRMAIQHPMQAQAFNGLKINQEQAMDVWKRFLSKKYSKTPFWMYTKGVKKSKEEKEAKINISGALIEEYAKRHQMDLKTVYEALKMFPKDMQTEIKSFEKTQK